MRKIIITITVVALILSILSTGVLVFFETRGASTGVTVSAE